MIKKTCGFFHLHFRKHLSFPFFIPSTTFLLLFFLISFHFILKLKPNSLQLYSAIVGRFQLFFSQNEFRSRLSWNAVAVAIRVRSPHRCSRIGGSRRQQCGCLQDRCFDFVFTAKGCTPIFINSSISTKIRAAAIFFMDA